MYWNLHLFKPALPFAKRWVQDCSNRQVDKAKLSNNGLEGAFDSEQPQLGSSTRAVHVQVVIHISHIRCVTVRQQALSESIHLISS